MGKTSGRRAFVGVGQLAVGEDEEVVAVRRLARTRLPGPLVLARHVVEHQVEAQADALPAQLAGELAQVLDAAQVGADAAVVHHRVAAVVGSRPWVQQRHQVQVAHPQLTQVRRAPRHAGEVAGEAVGVGGVPDRRWLLEPVRGQRPLQVECLQLLGALGERGGGEQHEPLAHGGGVVVQRCERGVEVGEPAPEPRLEQLAAVVGQVGEDLLQRGSGGRPHQSSAAQTVTGTPLSAALPETSRRSGVGEVVDRDAGHLPGAGHPDTLDLVAVAVGQRHDAAHHVVARADLRGDLTDAGRDPDRGAVEEAARGEVVGMHQQVVAGLAAGQPGAVVHPGVVVRAVPAPDQHQLVRPRGGCLRRGAEPGEVGDHEVRREVDQLVTRSAGGSGIVGRSGPRSTPAGSARSARIVVRRPVSSRVETIVVGLTVRAARSVRALAQ